ncbi:hypothetical protein MVEN_01192200 [Mycena venus]|uniref:F-box domain-containing protein n=1 Tax=Mycena venus TaxID=2733690 RepID=A0A8H7CVW9_9AGAR|nr:hypothetical protein MVEN_01192200 [Mycena venus]
MTGGMALLTVPPEICAAICIEVDQSGLALLCRTSRLLLGEAQRILYHSVDLRGRGMDAVRSWTLTVTRRSHLAERVHALALQLPDISTLDTSDSVKIGRALRLCVNLKELRLLSEFAQYQRRVDGIHSWMMSECPFRLHNIEIDSESQNRWNAPFWKNQTEIRVLSMPYCRRLPAFFENQVPKVIALGLPLSVGSTRWQIPAASRDKAPQGFLPSGAIFSDPDDFEPPRGVGPP